MKLDMRVKIFITILIIILCSASIAFFKASVHAQMDKRVTEVRLRGAKVMEFSLKNSHHYFKILNNGGVMSVTSKKMIKQDVSDIRQHLEEISREFKVGNYGKPLSIHGKSMPGIEVMSNNYKDISVEYKELKMGGEISFTSQNPDSVKAIEVWFKAQVLDHGSDASLQHGDDSSMDDMITTKAMWEYHHPGIAPPARIKN